jgi:hypothetical protein
MVAESHASQPTDAEMPTRRQLGILLACFGDRKAAGKARHPLESKLRSDGDVILDTTELQVNAKHKASVHDLSRLWKGTAVVTLTWGLFGLAANGWKGLVIWAVVGAVCGAAFTYYSVHHVTKAELASIGTHMPADSSALLTFAETSDPRRLLAATAGHQTSAASAALVSPDLDATVFAGAENPIEVSQSSGSQTPAANKTSVVSMIVLRYPDVDTAKRTAARVAKAKSNGADAQIELVIKVDPNGHRHVTDPKFGPWAWAKSDIVSWGLFGVVVGAIAGAFGGGIFKGAVVTGIGWALFGLFAGALYGLWAGRSTTARRLKGIGPILAPGSSMLLAWAQGPVKQETLDSLATANAKRLVLLFSPIEGGGAVLEAP